MAEGLTQSEHEADTQPLEVVVGTEPPWLVNRDEHELPELGWDADGDGDVEGAETKVPEPAVLRGLLVAGVGAAGAILGKTFDVSWIDPAITAYIIVAPVVLGFWIRRSVSPASGKRTK